ncbi:NAD(P)/FAD-dependent oxidoreductase [Caldanaerobacter subterraneus]|uniref:NAD(P)/FAD-dependent oxidoreductase n=1 Tax=Caldanaerobacter subterraneus TaxID=911092 RepID=A0A7Y2L8I2_9THEO|nr:NAD(P)/FAD-dependent oxidoreductase [Caldanaerobacter subterraneus]
MRLKIAIIGAGISGLSCALALERHGIYCDIYERKHTIGNLFPFGEIILQIMTRPCKDPLDFFKKFGLVLRPLNEITRIVIKSPTRKVEIRGRLGYIFERGQGKNSIENQLAQQIKSKIFFNVNANYEDLKKSYDYVVIATGNEMAAKQLTEWESVVSARVKGGILLGDFEPHSVYVWFDRSYAKSGFAYLVPLSNKKASLILVATYTLKEEIEDLWQTFLFRESLKYKMIETFETELESGMIKEHQVGNVYLVGNAGGFLEPAFGFGLANSIKTSFYCADSIVKGGNYDGKVKDVLKGIEKMVELRKEIDDMRDEDYDRLLRIIGNPFIKGLIYKTNFNIMKHMPFFIKLIKKPGQ